MAISNNKEKYSVKVDKIKKVVYVTFIGLLTKEDCDVFFGVYADATKGVSAANYNVVIHCKEMGIFRPDVIPAMRQGYNEYSRYKHIQVVESTSATVNMQMKRIAKELGLLERVIFVKDESELKYL